LIKRKTFTPAGTKKINKANNICSPSPHPITRQFIVFLSADKSQAINSKANIPKKLTRLYNSIIITPVFIWYLSSDVGVSTALFAGLKISKIFIIHMLNIV
jgi:hypothetical protein